MSVKAMAWAFEKRVGDAIAKSVLLALADFANDDGVCWPSTGRIAFKAECARQTLFDKFRWLEQMGFLGRLNRQKEQKSSLYVLNIRDLQPQELGVALSSLATRGVTDDEGTLVATAGQALSPCGDKPLSPRDDNPCRPAATMNPSANHQKKERSYRDDASLISSQPEQPQPDGTDQSKTVSFGEYDFVSDDGSLVIRAADFAAIGRECPNLTQASIRNLTRHAARAWLLDHKPEERLAKLRAFFRRKNDEPAKQRAAPAPAGRSERIARGSAERAEREAQQKRRNAVLEGIRERKRTAAK